MEYLHASWAKLQRECAAHHSERHLSVDICVADTANEKHFMLAKANSLTCDTLTSAANALLLLHSLRPCLYILFILLPGLVHGNEGSAITPLHGAHRYLPELRGDRKYHH